MTNAVMHSLLIRVENILEIFISSISRFYTFLLHEVIKNLFRKILMDIFSILKNFIFNPFLIAIIDLIVEIVGLSMRLRTLTIMKVSHLESNVT